MSKGRLTRRSMRARALAGALLTSFVLFTTAPVCGSPTDVDAAACCKRHGCLDGGARQASPSRVQAVERSTRAGIDRVTSSDRAAEDCCRRGALAYPAVESPSSSSPATCGVHWRVVMAGAHGPRLTAANVAASAATRASPLLTRPPTALYKLDSAYRI